MVGPKHHRILPTHESETLLRFAVLEARTILLDLRRLHDEWFILRSLWLVLLQL